MASEKESDVDKMRVIVTKKTNVLRETFGTLKSKRSTQEMLNETDHELDIEE